LLCPVCHTTQVVEIGLTLGGQRVVLHSCSACDARWWDDTDGRVTLGRVLELVGRGGRRRR
jgi:hypothetical protein